MIAFDGAKATIRTDRLGLRYPRGVALHPDGVHYVVSGSWSDLITFRRADHEVMRPRCYYETFFEHSHLTVASPACVDSAGAQDYGPAGPNSLHSKS